MTANTDTGAENFENSINTESENPSDEKVSSKETDNISQNQETEKIASKIFDPAVFRMMEKDNGEVSREANNPSLRTYEPGLLKELGIYALYMNGTRRSMLPLEEDLRKNGEGLINYLKKQYHLE